MDLLEVDGDDACGTSVVACLKSSAGKKGSASKRGSGSMKGSSGQWGIAGKWGMHIMKSDTRSCMLQRRVLSRSR